MPFYIFRVWRAGDARANGAGRLELLHTFPLAPLTEADGYGRASAQLRELRRGTDPRAGYYLHLSYGDDEADAEARLLGGLE